MFTLHTLRTKNNRKKAFKKSEKKMKKFKQNFFKLSVETKNP